MLNFMYKARLGGKKQLHVVVMQVTRALSVKVSHLLYV
jgi:hypothetical protein